MQKLGICFVALGLFLGNSVSQGATLVTYSFGTDLSPTTTGSGLTATPFSGTGTARSINSYAYQYPLTANAGYMEFTLTAGSTDLLDLSDVSFTYDFLQSGGTQATVQGTIGLSYSLDSFASSTSVQSFNRSSGAVVTSGATTFISSGTLSLSGIPDAHSIAFRFNLSNNGGLNTSNYRYGIDNVIINGNVTAIPEPSSFVLAGAGIGLFFFLSRRPKHPTV